MPYPPNFETDLSFPGMGLGQALRHGYGVARGTVLEGTSLASDYLRQGYENLFNARSQGMIGAFDEANSRYGAQAASQGLSPDVLQRLMYSPGMELQTGLGAARGEAQSGLAFDLAKLYKGTAGELAGLDEAQVAAWVNKEAAKRAARAARNAGLVSAFGSILGSIPGAVAGGMGGPPGAGAGGGRGAYGYTGYEDQGYPGYGPTTYGPYL